MGQGPLDKLAAAWRWFACWGGYMLLTASPARLREQPPRRFRGAWAQLMLISLAWGAFLAWLWSTAGTVFGDHSGMHLMHAAAVMVATAGWLYRRSLLALARCLGGRNARTRSLTATLLLLVLVLTLLGLHQAYDPALQANVLPPALRWICPMVVQRVLILTPLWGGWAMLVTCLLGKAADGDLAVAAFARTCTAPAVAVAMVVPLAGTLLYLYFLNWWRVLVPGGAICAALVGGYVLCRTNGGLSRRVLLANNFLTQLAFMLFYLAARQRL